MGVSDGRLSRDAVHRLSDQLRRDAARLCEALLPGGQRYGRIYRAARRSAGGPGDSLTVYLDKGKWRHFGGGLNGLDHGDMLDLIAITQRLDKIAAGQWGLRWLGLVPGQVELRTTPAEEANRQREAAARLAAQRQRLVRAREAGKQLWLAMAELSGEDPASLYLAGRIPGFETLLKLGWGLRALRWAAALTHPMSPWPYAALVARCVSWRNHWQSFHRHYLVERKPGQWDRLRPELDRNAKGEGLDGKLAWCALDGAYIPVWRGSRVTRDGEIVGGFAWHDRRAGPDLLMCEGLENAVSLAVACPDRRIAAAISLPNLLHVELPPWCAKLVWIADNDAGNAQAQALLDRALQRLQDAGADVAVATMPAGVKDANDLLRLDQSGRGDAV